MDLLERLRKVEPDLPGDRTRWYRNPDGHEAAAEIERLREALQELIYVMPLFPPDANRIVGAEQRYNDALIKARAALKEKK